MSRKPVANPTKKHPAISAEGLAMVRRELRAGETIGALARRPWPAADGTERLFDRRSLAHWLDKCPEKAEDFEEAMLS